MTDPIPVTVASPDPMPVAIIAPTPMLVEVTNPPPPPPVGVDRRATMQSQTLDPSVPAKTTFQEDLTTAGQRQINLIWERTQSFIAVAVVGITMIASLIGMVYELMIPNLVAVAFGTVIGFYFSRTNHAAIGGVGAKHDSATQEYRGR